MFAQSQPGGAARRRVPPHFVARGGQVVEPVTPCYPRRLNAIVARLSIVMAIVLVVSAAMPVAASATEGIRAQIVPDGHDNWFANVRGSGFPPGGRVSIVVIENGWLVGSQTVTAIAYHSCPLNGLCLPSPGTFYASIPLDIGCGIVPLNIYVVDVSTGTTLATVSTQECIT